MRRRTGLLRYCALFFGVIAIVFVTLSIINRSPDGANAASLDNFNAGNIISDDTMSNYESMSLDDIQRFLSSHGNCNDRNTYIAGYYPSVHYHIKDGHFVCLADERFGDGYEYGDLLPEGAGESAAKIIYDVSREYRINPQVLIVLLEKEQGLITDSYPNSIQYRSATGFGCPDTAACDSEYYGLKNQLRFAARLFRTVLDGGWTNYPVGNNYIAYNPNSSCGGSVVNIENRATSALYRYTPYQPNAGAISAGYGTSYCGSYGNRNFYLYFYDWFGDPVNQYYSGPEIDSGIYQISSSYNSSKAIDVDGGIFVKGRNVQVYRKWRGNLSQEWELVNIRDDLYAVVNPSSGLVLSAHNGDLSYGSNVELSEWSNTCSKLWKIKYEGNYKYRFVSGCNDSIALDLANYDTNLHVYINWGVDNKAQLWNLSKVKYSSGLFDNYSLSENEDLKEPVIEELVEENDEALTEPSASSEDVSSIVSEEATPAVTEPDFSEGTYTIHPLFDESLAIDVDYARKDNRTNIKVYKSSSKNKAQEWRFEKRGDYYIIKNPNSNRVLDVANGSLTGNTNIWLYDDNNSCAQRWKLVSHSNTGGYEIANACSEKMALDVQDFRTNVQLYFRWGDLNKAQIWKIERF